MEIENVRSELFALIKLYGLLQNSEDSLQRASPVDLDENAKLFLKNLLDRATERVLDTHEKIRAAQSKVFDKPFATQPEHHEATMKLQPPASLDLSKASPTSIKTSSKNVNYQKVVSPKEEQPINKRLPNTNVLERSKVSVSVSKPEGRKNRCQVCNRRKQPSLTRGKEVPSKNTQSPNSKIDQDQGSRHVKALIPKKNLVESVETIERSGQKRAIKFKRNSSAVKSLPSSSCTLVTRAVKPSDEHNLAGEIDKKPADLDRISVEVSETIKRIKSCLQDLQLPAEVDDTLKAKNAAPQGLFIKADSIALADKVCPIAETEREVTLGSESSQTGGNSVLVGLKPFPVASGKPSRLASQKEGNMRESDDLLDHFSMASILHGNALNPVVQPALKGPDMPIHRPGKNVKAIVEKIESLNRLRSENDHLSSQAPKNVYGFRVSPGLLGSALHAKMPSKENQEQTSMAQNEMIEPNRMAQAVSPHQKLIQIQAKELPRKKYNPPPQIILRPTLLDYNSSKIMMQPALDEDHKEVCKSTHVERHSRIMPRQQLSEETSSSSGSFSSWTSQEASTSSSESEEYVPPRRRRSPFVGRSGRLGHVTSDSSSEESSFSHDRGSYYQDHRPCSSEGSSFSNERGSYYQDLRPSRRVSPSKRTLGLTGQVKSQKQAGRLRRLKNKLGLVLHHHHHHHHHHHNQGKDDDHAEVGHAMSLWKHVRKIFNHSNKNEGYENDRAVKKLGKSVVSNVPSKNQHSHFHALVEGLMKHVRHSKKSKPSGGKLSMSGTHNKKAGKKLHWWQMFKHKRVKRSNRGRVKLGYISKKPQLKAAKLRP